MRRGARGLSAAARKRWNATYAQTPYRELPWFSPRPYPWVRRAARTGWLQPGTRVLDVGCGAGTNALFLSRSGYRVSGVDVAPAAIAAAQTRSHRAGVKVDFRVADALRLPFPRASFGGANDVGCFHSLPFGLRRAYAKEVARVLRPSGRFLLACVAREWTRPFGPPHRLALEEITSSFEPEFIFLRTEFTPGWGGVLPAYDSLLERRSRPQPSRR